MPPLSTYRHWKQNLFVLSLAQFLSMVGMSFFLPFIPLYLSELGVSDPASSARWSGVIVGSGFFVLSLVVPFWGNLADRWGRKLMVVRAMGTGAVILLLTSLVHTPSQLLWLRMLHGCFSGFVSSAIALIAAETPEHSLGFGMGVFQSALSAGFILGPLAGGFLHDAIGIRPTIVGGGVFLVIGTALVAVFVKEHNRPATHVPKGNVLQNIKTVFTSPYLAPAARIQLLSNLAMMLVQPILALFVGVLAAAGTEHLGLLSGLAVSASAVAMMIGAPLWGRVADRVGQKETLMLCLFASGLLFLPQGLSQNVIHLIISRFAMGFFAAGISPALQSVIALHAPAERKAGVLGVSFSITLMGNALGPLLGGFLASALGFRWPFVLVAVILIASGFLSRSLPLKLEKTAYPPVPEMD